jgi:hypothetical protein
LQNPDLQNPFYIFYKNPYAPMAARLQAVSVLFIASTTGNTNERYN